MVRRAALSPDAGEQRFVAEKLYKLKFEPQSAAVLKSTIPRQVRQNVWHNVMTAMERID